jgi:hypothetical protein
MNKNTLRYALIKAAAEVLGHDVIFPRPITVAD